jgi:uroporphyrinogen-III decarboxylase
VTFEYKRDGADTTVIWHTPRGDLRETSRRCRDDGTSYCLEHVLKGPQDLPVLASVFEDETFELNPEHLAVLEGRRKLIGDDGIIAFPMSSTPLGMLIRAYAGVETTAYLHADAPEALRELFAVMEENFVRRTELGVQFDGDVIITVDDTSTTTISPAMFETYCMAYTDRLADITHRAGKLYLHHSCGLIRDLLSLYRQTKMDGVHGFTIPPIGNVTVGEGRRRLGPRISIFAGLMQLCDPFDDWDAVARKVREMFEQAAPGDGFVAGLFGEPTKNMDDTRRLLDECRKYQKCPIRA